MRAEVATDPIEDHVVVRELTRRLAEAAERIRARMDRVSELDAPSEDVLIEVLRSLEEQLWMIRVQRPGVEASLNRAR
jgi:DNA-binding ferritin-like protein